MSYGLGFDIESARKTNAAAHIPSGRRKRQVRAFKRAVKVADMPGVKHAQMRAYYAEAAIFRSILDGAPLPNDLHLVYFPEAARFMRPAARASLRMQIAALDMQDSDNEAHSEPVTGDEAGKSTPARAEPHEPPSPIGSDVEADPETAPYCPKYIKLRLFAIELDMLMRVLHMGIFGIVIAARYGEIMKAPVETVGCGNLADFFAMP